MPTLTSPLWSPRGTQLESLFGDGFEGASYGPADTFATVGGAWFYGWDSTDLKVNSDGTGGAVADGGTVGRWDDRSGNGNHISQSTASLRPVWKDNTVRCFWATNTTSRQATLANLATDAIARADCSGGMVIDIPGGSGSPIIDFGASDFAIIATSVGTDYTVLRIFNGASFPATTLPYSARKCIITWRSNGSGLTFNVDGVEQTITALSAASMTRIRIASYNGGSPRPMNYREIVAFDEDVGATAIENLRTYLQTQADTAAIDTTKTVQIYGDSMSLGVGSEIGKPWPDYVTNRAASKWHSWSMDGGYMFAPHVSTATILSFKGATEGVVIYWIGTNDINSGARTGLQLAANLKTASDTLRAGGCKVVVCNLQQLPANDVQALAFNAQLIVDSASYDAIVDLRASFPDYTNTTYFTTDTVHMKDAGYAVVGGLIQTAMAALA